LEALATSPAQIELRHGNEQRVVPLTIRVVANSLGFLRALALAGAGVAAIPTVMCVDEERRGDLVRLLPGWSPSAMESHYVVPSAKQLSVATRRFIEMLIAVHDEIKRSGRS
jgi:DNA-binding transcriptional LysR family regulator